MDEAARHERRGRLLRLVAYAAGLALVVLLLAAVDWPMTVAALRRARVAFLAAAVGVSFLSYLAWGLAYVGVNHAFGVRLGLWRQLGVGFVSVGIAHTLSLGGVAQHGVRAVLLRRWGASLSRILAASLYEAYLNAIVLYGLLPLAVLYLVWRIPGLRPHAPLLAAATTAFLLVFAVLAALFFVDAPRRRLLDWAGRAWRRLTRRDASAVLGPLHTALSEGTAHARRHPLTLAGYLLLILVERAAMFASLALAVAALDIDVPFLLVAAAAVVGVLAGWVSMIPGGFGVQEATLSGVFGALAVPFDLAVLAAVLFRLIHYALPGLASLVVYGILIHTKHGHPRPAQGS